MIRLFTTLFPLILSGLVASPAAFASPDSLSPAALQQALASDVSKICADLPSLRSAALPAILNQLYQSNGHNALWKDTQRRKILQAELGKLVDDGLTPGDYAFALKAVVPVHYCDELRISSDYLLALEHLSLGRLAQQ